MTSIRIATWNILGGDRPDLGAVAAVLADADADVVALQEVQRRQATELGRRLDMAVEWRLKHHPLIRPAEGQAVLSRHPMADATRHVVAVHGVWSYRRRIALATRVHTPAGALHVLCVHLGSDVDEATRARQATRALDATTVGETIVVAGDLNTEPGSATLAIFAGRGFVDPWDELDAGPREPTNWARGPRTAPPSQHLDYVLVRGDLVPTAVSVPVHGTAGFDRFPMLSDHLPVIAEYRFPSSATLR